MLQGPLSARRPLRILADVDFYYPSQLGGSELALHGILRWLAGRGHEVKACVKRRRAKGRTDGVYHGYPGLRGRQLWWQWCDVGITQHAATEQAAKFADVYDKPLVFYSHNRGQVGQKSECLPEDSLVLFNADAERAPWTGPAIVVRPPVFVTDYQTSRGDSVTLVNLSELKGGPVLWNLAERCPSRQFLGVKGAWQVPGDVQVVPASRAPNVRVIGPVRDMRMQVYCRTRVLLMPSWLETFGRVGIEAGASGIPVIAHPTDGLREALGDSAIWVDRKDPDEWVSALDELDDPVTYREFSGAAAEVAREHERRCLAELEQLEAALYEQVRTPCGL